MRKVSHVFKCFAGLKPQSLDSDKTGQCLLSSSESVLFTGTWIVITSLITQLTFTSPKITVLFRR